LTSLEITKAQKAYLDQFRQPVRERTFVSTDYVPLPWPQLPQNALKTAAEAKATTMEEKIPAEATIVEITPADAGGVLHVLHPRTSSFAAATHEVPSGDVPFVIGADEDVDFDDDAESSRASSISQCGSDVGLLPVSRKTERGEGEEWRE
jgi:hypothetical protein